MEEDPLLLPPVSNNLGEDSHQDSGKKKPSWILSVVLIFAIISIIDVSAFLANLPKTRVFEANICLSYYQKHDPSVISDDGSVPEHLCKVDKVQQKLAMIFGWQDMFDAIPGILLAVPLGAMADRYGRKWVLATSLMGLQLSSAWTLLICYFRTLPLQLTWFSGAFYFVGGGPIVAMAIGITILSDIVPTEKRTPVFLLITADSLISEMLTPILAARLMEYGDWLPLILSLAIKQAGICFVFVLPETLPICHLSESQGNGGDEVVELRSNSIESILKAQMHNFHAAFQFVRSDWTLGVVIFTFLANRLGTQSLSLVIRYASKRYGWEIRKAAYLLSLRAATNLIAIAIFVPLTNFVLLRAFRLPTHWADLYIARGSAIVITISFFVMAIASHPVLLVLGLFIYNFGTGYNAAMRSLSIHVIGGQSSADIGKLMSTIAITESVGAMVAGPLLSGMFQWGMDLGSAWIGLPFLVSVFFFAGMTVMTFLINVEDCDFAYTVLSSNDQHIVGMAEGESGARTLDTGQEFSARHSD